MLTESLLKITKQDYRPTPMHFGFKPICAVYDTHSILSFSLPIGEESEWDALMLGSLLIDISEDGQIAGVQIPLALDDWHETDQTDYYDSKVGVCHFDLVELNTSKEVNLVRNINNLGVVFGQSKYFIQLADSLVVGIGDEDLLMSLWLKNVGVDLK